MRAPDILADLPADQVDVAWSDFLARDVADYGVPNVYRVRPNGRGRWQCEWDDWSELGAWRSRWLGRCDDRIDYDAQFDEGTARDDYDIRPIWASDRLGQIIDQHHAMCDEIDHLRAESAAFRDLAGCCSDCEWEGVEIVHRPMCARWQSAEIAEVADRIANGHATCGATWRDTEATGWLWYCSLPVGHAGHHRCVGASW